MEKNTHLTGSSFSPPSSSSYASYYGSSSVAELFDSSSSISASSSTSASSSAGIFRSVFGPSSMGKGRNSTTHVGNVKNGNGEERNKGEKNKNNYYEGGRIEEQPSCYYSSSIYYGAQEIYSPSASTLSSHSHSNFKKDEQDDNPNSASRGDWWQGSLYY